jgi:hypothetical protein
MIQGHLYLVCREKHEYKADGAEKPECTRST